MQDDARFGGRAPDKRSDVERSAQVMDRRCPQVEPLDRMAAIRAER